MYKLNLCILRVVNFAGAMLAVPENTDALDEINARLNRNMKQQRLLSSKVKLEYNNNAFTKIMPLNLAMLNNKKKVEADDSNNDSNNAKGKVC